MKIAVDCKRGQTGLVSLVVCIVVIDGIWTKSSLFTPLGRSKSLCARRTNERSRVRSPAALNMLRRCAPTQGTLLTCALSRSRSKWVPGRAVKACVFK